MKVHRIDTWRWWPRVYRPQVRNAPYRTLIHVGFWLIFWGDK